MDSGCWAQRHNDGTGWQSRAQALLLPKPLPLEIVDCCYCSGRGSLGRETRRWLYRLARSTLLLCWGG